MNIQELCAHVNPNLSEAVMGASRAVESGKHMLPMIREAQMCRICGGSLNILVSFGEIYPSCFLAQGEKPIGPFPLILKKCSLCGLIQLGHTLDTAISYRKYWYKSGLNTSMRDSLRDVATDVMKRVVLNKGDTIIDIGCNDGTFFSFMPANVYRIGFDPALNLADTCKKHCDELFSDFFAAGIYSGNKAKVVTSIAMFYDVDNPGGFIEAVKEVLHESGLWVIQMMDLRSMLVTGGFDNVCFEHLIYYTLGDIKKLLEMHGLYICDVSYNNTNGGSLRVFVKQGRPKEESSYVVRMLQEEEEFLKKGAVRQFVKEVPIKCRKIRDMVRDTAKEGVVHVMGASTKGNTLLQMCHLDYPVLKRACDLNPDKRGTFTPGTDIPIVLESEDDKDPPDAYLLLPWHFAESIIKRHKAFLDAGGVFIVPLPEPRFVTERD